MNKMKKMMLATTLVCGTTTALTSCTDKTDNPAPTKPDSEQEVQDGMNKKITDGNYDKALAVKCINGTFVGKKTENNVIIYKGIPFVGQQPVGNLRWKAPVDYSENNGVYEAYYNGKTALQPEGDPAYNYTRGEDCLYLNIWKAAEGRSLLWCGFTAEPSRLAELLTRITSAKTSSWRIQTSSSLPSLIDSAL